MGITSAGNEGNDKNWPYIISPADGIGVIAVMKIFLENAGLKPEDVDHINTHGTSTPLGDVAELKAISEIFCVDSFNISMAFSSRICLIN